MGIQLDISFYHFADCIPIKGYTRSIIYDLSRKSFLFVPNDLVDFLTSISNKPINEITFKDENQSAYFDFLLENEIGELLPNKILCQLKSLNLEWDFPATINNAIIEVSNKTSIDIYFSFLQLLDEIGCKTIQLRIEELNLSNVVESILEYSNNLSITSIEVITNKSFLKISALKKLQKKYKITGVFIKSQIYDFKKGQSHKNNINQEKSRFNLIDRNNFTVNSLLFTESINFNTYFNRKLFFTKDGFLKNGPECENGNLSINKKKSSIIRAIQSKEFQKLWNIKKDLIDVCNVCEYRHMCVDPCIPRQRNNGTWYRKYECNYNPFICKWSDEEGYLNLSETGIICNHKEFKIDETLINEINTALWKD